MTESVVAQGFRTAEWTDRSHRSLGWKWSRLGFLGVCACLFVAADLCPTSAATVTVDAGTLGGANDLGKTVLTVTGSDGALITVASTGLNRRNLFGNTLAGAGTTGANVPTVGIIGGSADDAVKGGAGELMTVSFGTNVSISEVTFTGLGHNDDDLIVEGLPSSPGAVTFSTLGSASVTNLGYSYNASGTLTVDLASLSLSTGGTFAYGIVVSFQNPVALATFSFSADQTGADAGGVGLNSLHYTPQISMPGLVSVDAAHPQWQISPYLVGFHQVYSSVPDSVYADGSIAAWAKRVGASTSRFPGGTVVKYWDWENPTGVLNGDSWDPAWNPADNRPPSDWMSLDEYLTFVEQSGIRPLFGVNSLSGQVHNREAEGIARAVRMVSYVKARGFGGAFWYIGNEEGGSYPGGVSGYAKVFKRYAQAMKAEDPNILLFWNDNGAAPSDIQAFLANDGGTADGFETHGKWPYGGSPAGFAPGTYAEWLNEVPLRDRKNSNRAWRIAANTYRKAAATAGRPGLLIADNEYGIGSSSNFLGFTRYTTGLLLTEFLMEHFIGNWFSSCFWDMKQLRWFGLLDPNAGYRLNPFQFGMNMLADAQGGDYLATVSTNLPAMHGFAARKDGALLLYLLNKTTSNQPITIKLSGANYPTAFARRMQNSADGYGELVSIPVAGQGAQFTAALPPLTFTEFVFADPSTFLRVQSIARKESSVVLRWSSLPGARFDLDQSTTLSDWLPWQTNIAPDNLWTESEVPISTALKGFYRFRLKP